MRTQFCPLTSDTSQVAQQVFIDIMGIKYFKGSEHTPEGKGSIKVGTMTFVNTDVEGGPQSDAGTRRISPTVYVVEKGKPYTYTALGPSVIYIIEGEHILEDLTTPAPPILLTKGDFAVSSEGTVVSASSPSKARVFGVTYIDADTVISDALEA